MRTTLFVLLALFFSANASSQTAKPDGAMDLIKITPPGQNEGIDRDRCGDYFFLVHGWRPAGPRTGFLAKMSDGGNGAFAFLYEKFKTKLVQLAPPKVQVMVRDDRVFGLLNNNGKTPVLSMRPEDIQSVIIRISREEYEKSKRCLPPPEP